MKTKPKAEIPPPLSELERKIIRDASPPFGGLMLLKPKPIGTLGHGGTGHPPLKSVGLPPKD